MIPFELVTMLGSAVLGGVMQMWSMKLKANAQREQAMIARMDRSNKAVEAARVHPDETFKFTRRFIAIASVLSIIVLPILIMAFKPDVQISMGYTEFRPGFLFLPDKDVIVWKETHGLVIGPLHTHLVSAITGMYFGSSTVKN